MRPTAPAFRPKSSMQTPSAAEYSQKCTSHPTLGTCSKKANSLGEYVNEGPSDPARRFRLATFDGVKGGAKSKYAGRDRRARWGGFRPRLFTFLLRVRRLIVSSGGIVPILRPYHVKWKLFHRNLLKGLFAVMCTDICHEIAGREGCYR